MATFMNRTRVRMLSSAGLGALAAAAVCGQALAQAAPATVDEVVVTGTSIRGTAPIGATPTTFGKEELQQRSPTDVADALSNIPQLTNFGTEYQNSTTNRFRTAGYIPVIHNMEIGSTLTLINGHRTAAVGAEAVFPDPDTIPTIALERVEVVADGNSAVYGSDAVAGVVNFMFRKGFEGAEVDASVTYDPNSSYANRRASVLWGKNFGDGLGNVMIAAEHSEHDNAETLELPSAFGDHTAQGLTDRRGTVCYNPSVVFGGRTYSGAGLTTSGLARCDVNYDGQGASTSKRDSVLVTGRIRPTDTIEFNAEVNYSKYQAENPTVAYGTIDVNVPSTSPFFVVPPGANAAGVTTERVRRQSIDLFGTHPTQAASYSFYGVTLGSVIDVTDTWQVNTRVHHSFSYSHSGGVPGIDPQNLQALTTAGLFNPFATSPAGNSASVIAQILDGYNTYNFGKQSLTELELKADGPLFAIPGGEVKAAFGFNHRTETLRQIQTVGCTAPSCSFFVTQRDDDMARGVNSAFVEVSVPLISDANALPYAQELTLSLAGRYDKYDLLEGVFTPKVGFVYKPIDGVSLHASAGKSFAAPNIGYLTATFGIVQPGANIQGITYDIYNMGGGNPDLTPERAKTYSYGVDFKPPQIPGLSFGVSYYNVAYTNLVYKPSRDDVVFNPAFKSARIVGDESRPTTPVVIAQSVINSVLGQAPPDRPLAGYTFTLVHRSYAINLGSRNFAGVDLNARYDFDTAFGNIGLSANANKQITRETQVVAGGPFTNDIGSRVAPAWQANVGVNWRAPNLPLRMGWDTNYMSGYDDRFGSACCKIDENIRHNLNVAYDLENVLNGVTLQLRVTNVTDKDPPLYDTAAGYDSSNATPYGRQFTFTVKSRF